MSSHPPTVKYHHIFLLLLVVLCAVALFFRWMIVKIDREMRTNLLQQARLVMQAIDINNVKALTGTEADIRFANYQRLKEQLAATRSVNPKCRFVYLLGRRADGTVFIFVDSETAGTKDYSPPGQVYEEVPAEYRRVFDNQAADVVGPITDRWGMWVSALTPIQDQAGGAVIAVLGMDINAESWRWDIAAHAALPGGLMLLLLLLGFMYFLLRRTHRRIQAQQAALTESEEKYRILVENANEAIIILQDDAFVFANRKMSELLSVPAADLEGKRFTDFIWPDDRERIAAYYGKLIAGEAAYDACDFRFVGAEGKLSWVFLSATMIPWKGRPATLNLMNDITDRKRAEDEREKLIAELKEALANVKLLSGLLPICAACKKIRNDKGYWEQMELYIRNHSEAEFSHGICPECAERMYPDLDKEK